MFRIFQYAQRNKRKGDGRYRRGAHKRQLIDRASWILAPVAVSDAAPSPPEKGVRNSLLGRAPLVHPENHEVIEAQGRKIEGQKNDE
jgi:hypothetical protein